MKDWLKGILERFSENPKLDEILINGNSSIIEIAGSEVATRKNCFNQSHWIENLQDLAFSQGVRMDPITPAGGGTISIIQKASKDSFRWHAIIPPANSIGVFSIRRHRFDSIQLEDFEYSQNFSSTIHRSITQNQPIIIIGATGSGKSAFLSAVLNKYCHQERIIFLESLPEFRSNNPSWVFLTQSPPSLERANSGLTLDQLLSHSLRLRPDRLVLGELRDEEGPTWGKMLSTGHLAPLTTMHGENTQDTFEKVRFLTKELIKANQTMTFIIMSRGSPPSVESVSQI